MGIYETVANAGAPRGLNIQLVLKLPDFNTGATIILCYGYDSNEKRYFNGLFNLEKNEFLMVEHFNSKQDAENAFYEMN